MNESRDSVNYGYDQSQSNSDSVVLEEEYDPNYEPTEEEIVNYAVYFKVDLDRYPILRWIAREGLCAPLPKSWKPCRSDKNEVYYFNFDTGDSLWEHPCDVYFKKVLDKAMHRQDIGLDVTGTGIDFSRWGVGTLNCVGMDAVANDEDAELARRKAGLPVKRPGDLDGDGDDGDGDVEAAVAATEEAAAAEKVGAAAKAGAAGGKKARADDDEYGFEFDDDDNGDDDAAADAASAAAAAAGSAASKPAAKPAAAEDDEFDIDVDVDGDDDDIECKPAFAAVAAAAPKKPSTGALSGNDDDEEDQEEESARAPASAAADLASVGRVPPLALQGLDKLVGDATGATARRDPASAGAGAGAGADASSLAPLKSLAPINASAAPGPATAVADAAAAAADKEAALEAVHDGIALERDALLAQWAREKAALADADARERAEITRDRAEKLAKYREKADADLAAKAAEIDAELAATEERNRAGLDLAQAEEARLSKAAAALKQRQEEADAQAAAAEKAEAARGRVLAERRAAADAAEQAVAEAEAAVATRRAAAAEAGSQFTAASEVRADYERRLDGMRAAHEAEAEELTVAAALAKADAQRLATELAAAKSDAAVALAAAAAAEDKARGAAQTAQADARADLDAASARAAAAATAQAAAEAESARLRTQLADTVAEVETLRGQVEGLRAAAGADADVRVAQLLRQLETAQLALDEGKEQKATLKVEVSELRTELAAATAQVRAAEAARAAAAAAAAGADERAEAADARATAAEARAVAAEARATAAEGRAAPAEARAAAAEEERARAQRELAEARSQTVTVSSAAAQAGAEDRAALRSRVLELEGLLAAAQVEAAGLHLAAANAAAAAPTVAAATPATVDTEALAAAQADADAARAALASARADAAAARADADATRAAAQKQIEAAVAAAGNAAALNLGAPLASAAGAAGSAAAAEALRAAENKLSALNEMYMAVAVKAFNAEREAEKLKLDVGALQRENEGLRLAAKHQHQQHQQQAWAEEPPVRAGAGVVGSSLPPRAPAASAASNFGGPLGSGAGSGGAGVGADGEADYVSSRLLGGPGPVSAGGDPLTKYGGFFRAPAAAARASAVFGVTAAAAEGTETGDLTELPGLSSPKRPTAAAAAAAASTGAGVGGQLTGAAGVRAALQASESAGGVNALWLWVERERELQQAEKAYLTDYKLRLSVAQTGIKGSQALWQEARAEFKMQLNRNGGRVDSPLLVETQAQLHSKRLQLDVAVGKLNADIALYKQADRALRQREFHLTQIVDLASRDPSVLLDFTVSHNETLSVLDEPRRVLEPRSASAASAAAAAAAGKQSIEAIASAAAASAEAAKLLSYAYAAHDPSNAATPAQAQRVAAACALHPDLLLALRAYQAVPAGPAVSADGAGAYLSAAAARQGLAAHAPVPAAGGYSTGYEAGQPSVPRRAGPAAVDPAAYGGGDSLYGGAGAGAGLGGQRFDWLRRAIQSNSDARSDITRGLLETMNKYDSKIRAHMAKIQDTQAPRRR